MLCFVGLKPFLLVLSPSIENATEKHFVLGTHEISNLKSVCLIMTVGKIELSAILKYKLFVSSVYKVEAVISNGSNKDICIEK